MAFVSALTQMVFGVSAPNGALWAAARRGAEADAVMQTPTQLTPQTADNRAVRARSEMQVADNVNTPDMPIGGDYTSRIDSSGFTPESGSIVNDAPQVVDTYPTKSAVMHKGSSLEGPITGKNKDSLVFDIRDRMVYIYRSGDVTYQSMNMKADFMAINLENRQIRAYGINDTVNNEQLYY